MHLLHVALFYLVNGLRQSSELDVLEVRAWSGIENVGWRLVGARSGGSWAKSVYLRTTKKY